MNQEDRRVLYLTLFALDAALDAVAVVFLLGAILYGYRLSTLTRGAEIVALAKPKVFFSSILVSFVSLFAAQLLILVNDFVISIPYVVEIERVMIILTALLAVFGLYTAVYYYRTSARPVSGLAQRQTN